MPTPRRFPWYAEPDTVSLGSLKNGAQFAIDVTDPGMPEHLKFGTVVRAGECSVRVDCDEDGVVYWAPDAEVWDITEEKAPDRRVSMNPATFDRTEV